ncbi:hypothetical protein K469DRAFT_691133 [Zopfia rhizophila CBS 207.26]|uniref:Nephrocystin 3-like N-terminal domain-containing protein n=1 Tax=Zopfia rhizophila CBS 207.26 TaxID=1314779 RepID=A0A6A6EQM7_9PEZI|nr:hypothetical protein K469DRAFT_691133 [Zopfia rhizophila CBS 207.26]
MTILDEFQRKIVISSGVGKVVHALAWKFNKAEVDRMLSRMERLKVLILISLEMDHFKLSKAVNNDIKDIKTIAEWISPTVFPAQQSDLIARREEGTGQWFLDSPEFADWLREPRSTLFCPSIPGTGKTMLAAITIEHLSQMQGSGNIGFTHMFCNYKFNVGNTSHFLAALLKQLVQIKMRT